MLIYNFKRVFKARGIENPPAFLVNHGFSRNVASRIANNKTNKILLRHLEKVCLLLNCTPNDILEWKPDNKSKDHADTALFVLKKKHKSKGAEELLRSLPMSKLEEIAKLLKKE